MPPSIHKPSHSSWDALGGESRNLLKTIGIIRQMCGVHRQQLDFLQLLSQCHAGQVKDILVTQDIPYADAALGLLLLQQARLCKKAPCKEPLSIPKETNHLCVGLWFPQCISACPTKRNFMIGDHIHPLFNNGMVMLTEMGVDL